MHKIVSLLAKGVAALAIVTTMVNVNSACTCFAYQPEIPEEAMKLKKW